MASGRPVRRGDELPLTEALISFVAGKYLRPEYVEGKGYRPVAGIPARQFAERVDYLLGLYPWPVTLTQLNLLDSHDTARFISIAGGDVSGVRLATLLLFTLPGAPSIYYGDEIGLTGGGSDALARRSMPWDRPAEWNRELLRFHREIVALRHTFVALRVGSYHRLHADDETFTFGRVDGGEQLLIAVNTSTAARSVRVPLGPLQPGTDPRVVFGGGTLGEVQPASVVFELPPREAVVVLL